MRQRKTELLLGLFAAIVMIAAVGCGSGSSGGSSGSSCAGIGSSGQQGLVDLAIGDDEGDGTNDLVHLFFDILGNADTNPMGGNTTGPDIEPDLTFDNSGGTVGNPVSSPDVVVLTGGTTAGGGDLYVNNSGFSEILIWRDYRNAADDAEADVMLDNSGNSGFSNVTDMVVDANDNLIMSDDGNDVIVVYNSASALTGDGVADADYEINGTCTGFTLCINDPVSIFVTGDAGTGTSGDLYVANESSNNGDPVVAIFRDINAVTGDEDPDAALTEDVSFFDLGFVAHELTVSNNILYVSADDFDQSAQIFMFLDADALSTDALPDAVIYGPAARLDEPVSLLVVNNTLYAANTQDELTFDPLSGVVGFFNAANLTNGQQANVALDPDTSNISATFDIQSAGGAFFVTGFRSEDGDFNGDDAAQVAIFRNIGSGGLCNDSLPNIVLNPTGIPMPGDAFGPFGNVADPHGIFAIAVDQGT